MNLYTVLLKPGLSIASVAIVAAMGLTACVSEQASTPDQSESTAGQAVAPTESGVLIDGSSTVYPITDAIAKAYRNSHSDVTIDVKFSGSSAGFQQFCAGKTDISNASRPILLEEMQTCAKAGVGFIELPIAFDALTIAVNPSNTWTDSITLAELKALWQPSAQATVTLWSQVRPSYPKQPIALFGAGQDSGTFDYFNDVVSGNADASRTDYTASEDDNELVDGIAKNPNALGYVPFSYYEENRDKLKALAIDNGNGLPIMPSRENVENATYQPFSRPLFIYVNLKSAQTKPEVKDFVEFYLKTAKTTVPMIGYVPLPDEGYHLVTVQFHQGKVGTVFEGVPQPNVTIAELLRRQAVFQINTAQQPLEAPARGN